MSITKVTDAGLDRSRIVTPLIINGDMSVAQRATSATGIGNGDSGYHTVDRWQFTEVGTTSGEFTITQDTDVPTGQGFAKSTKFDVTTADTSLGSTHQIYWRQGLEGQNLQMLKKGTSSAEKVTVSFWVKSNKTGTYIVYLLDGDNSRFVCKAYTISSSSTWEKKVISFPADTTGTLDNDNEKSLTVHFALGAGSDFNSGTLQETWAATSGNNANRLVGQVNLLDNTSNEWYLTGVQMEVGEFDSNTIPSFPFESFESNLKKCQRYYQLARIWWGGDATNGEEYRAGTQLSTDMRATTSVTYTHLDSANFSTSATSQSSTSYNLAIRVAAATSASARYYVFGAVADSEL